MTRQEGTNAAGGSSVNDNAATGARGKRRQKPAAGKPVRPKGYSAEIKTLTQKIKKIQSKELEARVEIGSELLKAKDLLEHGEFRAWLQSEFRWSERTATNYMELSRHYAGKSANFADLDLGTALALVADKRLEEVRDETFERAKRGEKIIRKDVQKQIADVKAAAPKRPAKAKTSAPSAATEAFLATGKSPAEEIAEALLTLLTMVEKSKPRCEPDEVAEFFMNDDLKRSALANTGSFAFVSSVTEALLRIPEVQLKIAS